MDDSYILNLSSTKFIFLSQNRVAVFDLLDCGIMDPGDRYSRDNDLLSKERQARTLQDCCFSCAFEGLLATF